MAILFRFFLIALLIFLIVRMVREFFSGPKDDGNVKPSSAGRKVSKKAGEYVDYEEVKDKKGRSE